VTGGFGGVTTAIYSFPVVDGATNPLAQAAARGSDEDGDGIIDSIDQFDDSGHLPVVVDEEAGAGASLWHHIRPALRVVHNLRLGEATVERRAMATDADQVDDYAEYSASETPSDTSNLPSSSVLYNFEIAGVDYDDVGAEVSTGGVAGVIIPLARSLYGSRVSLWKQPANEQFRVEGGNDYGFAPLQDGRCPDGPEDTMQARSPYHEGDGTLRRVKRTGADNDPIDACLLLYSTLLRLCYVCGLSAPSLPAYDAGLASRGDGAVCA